MDNPRKMSRDEILAEIHEEAIYRAFLERPDIAPLEPKEQERRWQEHLVKIYEFLTWTSTQETYVI